MNENHIGSLVLRLLKKNSINLEELASSWRLWERSISQIWLSISNNYEVLSK